jgi:hypothetical protein
MANRPPGAGAGRGSAGTSPADFARALRQATLLYLPRWLK